MVAFKLLDILGCVVDYARATAARAIKNVRSLRSDGFVEWYDMALPFGHNRLLTRAGWRTSTHRP